MTEDFNEMSAPSEYMLPVDRGDGKFEYIKCEYTRNMLINAFQAITISEMWDFVKKGPPKNTGFIFCEGPEIYKILDAMDKCSPKIGHSGATFGITLREMQYLATHGEKNYKMHCGM